MHDSVTGSFTQRGGAGQGSGVNLFTFSPDIQHLAGTKLGYRGLLLGAEQRPRSFVKRSGRDYLDTSIYTISVYLLFKYI